MSKPWLRTSNLIWGSTDCIEGYRHVEKNSSANLATVDDSDHIIVQPHKFCFRGMIAAYESE